MDNIDNTFYINLRTRQTRNNEMIQEFEKINFTNYKRFQGIHHKYGAIGCCKSHIAVLKKLNELNSEISMIIEDDLEFLVTREILDKYINSFLEEDYADVLCLSFSASEISRFNPELCRTKKTRTTSCYILKNKMIPVLINNFENSLDLMMDQVFEKPLIFNFPIDTTWNWIQTKNFFMIPVERCAKQRGSHSDVYNTYTNFGV